MSPLDLLTPERIGVVMAICAARLEPKDRNRIRGYNPVADMRENRRVRPDFIELCGPILKELAR